MQRVKALTESRFIRNVLIVASGTAGAQAITIAFSPIITRLYGPEAFGLLGTFVALLAVLTPMAAFTYPIAIVLPKEDLEAKSIAKLSMLLAGGFATITLISVVAWRENLSALIGIDAIGQYLWFIPLAMFLSALHQILEQWFIRHQRFKVTARVAVIQSGIINTAKVGAGLLHPFPMVLIVLQTLSSGILALLLWVGLGSTARKPSIKGSSAGSLLDLARKYRDFPMFRAPEVTINAASQGLPVLMLASLFGPASAGFYTLARTVLGMPAGLIGKSIGDVFYPRISEAANNREPLYPLVKKSSLLLAVAGLVPFGLVAAFGPWLFTFVFGGEWTMAGDYARWLALWIYVGFLNTPAVKAIPIIKAQAFQLVYTVGTLVLRLSALAGAYIIYESELAAVITFSLLGASINVLLISIVLQKCKRFDESRSGYEAKDNY